ncbi:MAG: PAS domain-containing protein, partial [Chloroflexi bacterium]
MFTLNFFSVALFISAIITGVVAVITYRRRAVIGATTLMWIMIALTWWSSVYAIENLSTSLAWHKFWSSAQYLGVAAIPPLWLVFAIQYSQQEKAPKARTLAWLGVIPIITIVMAWTNDWHGLLWPRMELIKFDDVTILDVDHGIYFWIQAVYAYLNIFAGTIIFARRTMQVGDAYRSQAVTMLLAAAVLLLGNGLYVFDLLPFKGLDITPFSFTFSGLLLAWGLFRHRLLDLMPVASENILQNMGDGVLVTDASNRIVYINPAFENLAGMLPETAIGQPAGEALFGWPNIFRGYEQKTLAEVEIPAGKSKIFLEMQVSPLFERG